MRDDLSRPAGCATILPDRLSRLVPTLENAYVQRYRLYIDESGDHTYSALEDLAKRYLGLTGCIVETEAYRISFQPALEALKQKHFPHSPDDPIILHRNDIIDRRGPFWRLRDEDAKRRFNEDLLSFLEQQDYLLITVVIDKKAHIERYGSAALHPYHYCLAVLLERYCGFLNRIHGEGDVMAESRGGTEDRQLQAAYQSIWQNGTYFREPQFFQRVLTSKEIKLKPKAANIAGLQIADLLAYPCKQEILLAHGRIQDPGEVFGKAVSRCVASKYNRRLSDG
ncbi:MAG: DUF3800 domain-containing protein, partial [Desulfofundulus sp.]